MSQQFLLFSAGSDTFAVDAFAVQQIHMPVPVTRLPHVAAYISGLVNIEGAVMPQIDLRKLLGKQATSSGQLLVLAVQGQLLAVLVDKALEKVVADDSQLNDFALANDLALAEGEDGKTSGRVDHIRSELVLNGQTALVLSADSLLLLLRPEAVPEEEGCLAVHRTSAISATRQREEKIGYLTFRLGQETLALPLLDILEVVEIHRFTHVPGSPAFIAGLALLRTQPLLVVNATLLLELQQGDAVASHSNRILVVKYAASWIGLLVDDVFGIQYFAQSQVIRETSSISFIDAYVVDASRTAILLLNLQSLLQSGYSKAIDQYQPHVDQQTAAHRSETVQMLKVLIGQEAFAIPVAYVQRIAEYRQFARVEESPKGIIGTVDIDGNIIPVVSVAKQLNTGEANDLNQWVVITADQEQWALCVTSATALFDIDVDAINYSASHRQLVKGIANHKGDLVSILDFQWLTGNEGMP